LIGKSERKRLYEITEELGVRASLVEWIRTGANGESIKPFFIEGKCFF
jgi:hypothetical protein